MIGIVQNVGNESITIYERLTLLMELWKYQLFHDILIIWPGAVYVKKTKILHLVLL